MRKEASSLILDSRGRRGDKSVIVGHRGWQRRSSYKEAVQLPQYRTNRSADIKSPTDSAHRTSEPRAGFRLRRLTPTSISSDSFRSLYSCSRSLYRSPTHAEFLRDAPLIQRALRSACCMSNIIRSRPCIPFFSVSAALRARPS